MPAEKPSRGAQSLCRRDLPVPTHVKPVGTGRSLLHVSAIVATAMTREIRPLEPGDLEDLSRFLTEGFHAAPDADFAAPEVLRWKYLEPTGEGEDRGPRSYLARDEAGTVIGHVGICPTAFEGAVIPGGSVATLHMIDWLGSPGHRSVGASLMRKRTRPPPPSSGSGGATREGR